MYQVKRFKIESAKDPVQFITEHADSKLAVHSLVPHPSVVVSFDKRSNDRPDEEVALSEFIAVKGVKALGNRLTPFKVKDIQLQDPVFIPMTPELEEVQGMLISEDEIGNMEAPEEEGLEESPMKEFRKSQQDEENDPDVPLIGSKPGKQISLGLD